MHLDSFIDSALVLKVIDESVFVMAVGVISLSMLLTPLLVRLGNALALRPGRHVDLLIQGVRERGYELVSDGE